MKRILYSFALLCASVLTTLGQTNASIENNLTDLYADIERYSAYGENHDSDKLSLANQKFAAALFKAAANPSALIYAFPKLSEKIIVKTSPDKNLRIYSWDTLTGGTMHFFNNLYQYRAADGKVYGDLRQGEDGDGYVNKIFETASANGKIYIVCDTAIASTIDRSDSINLYQIGKSRLESVNLFQTKSGLTNVVGYNYSAASLSEIKTDREGSLVSFDAKTKTLKFPVVLPNPQKGSGILTAKSVTYKFNGRYFVKTSR